jgi:pimeloyl-ACP methyl ester carboxylesterase
MLWIAITFGIGLLLACAIPLLHRKVRQSRIAATLAIASPRGIVEEGYVLIGGVQQWTSIRGEDVGNPAMLILHGGPGSSYSMFSPHLRGWEQHFTLVQWDQRGSGKSFAKAGPRGSAPLNFEQLTSDAIEVAEYVRERLGAERIFLLASSVGSTFGIRVAQRRPDLFYAYIGTDQNVGMGSAAKEDHQALVTRLRSVGSEKAAKAVERMGADPTHWSAKNYQDVARWMMRSDPLGFDRTMRLLKNAVWYAPHWTLRDIRAFVGGMHYSLEQLLPEIVRYDAWEEGSRFQIPFFIYQGEADVLTKPEAAKGYFDAVEAPLKHFSLIVGAGHFAAFLQPEQFLKELLQHVRPLAVRAQMAQPT